MSRWPAGIILFFVVCAFINFGLLYAALDGRQPPIEESPYEKGLNYQQHIDARNRTSNLGWKLELNLPDKASESAVVKVNLVGAGASISGASVKLRALRPADASLDKEIVLTESPGSPGNYTAPLPLKHGLWLLRVTVEKDGEILEEEREVTLKP